jgi:hypothetical protein
MIHSSRCENKVDFISKEGFSRVMNGECGKGMDNFKQEERRRKEG